MNPFDLKGVLEAVSAGELSTADALDKLKALPFESLGHTRLDHHRALRRGFPEVVLGEGKTDAQIVDTVRAVAAAGCPSLVSRVSQERSQALLDALQELAPVYHDPARVLVVRDSPAEIVGVGQVVIVSAGTSDLPVASEAAVCAAEMGNEVLMRTDVGVAGIHRLLPEIEVLRSARVLIVVAGMEGALASVVGGLVARPVIAVPTSVGYGAAFGGVAALLGMLTSCAAGVTVVNIDNGFGAAYAASLMNRP